MKPESKHIAFESLLKFSRGALELNEIHAYKQHLNTCEACSNTLKAIKAFETAELVQPKNINHKNLLDKFNGGCKYFVAVAACFLLVLVSKIIINQHNYSNSKTPYYKQLADIVLEDDSAKDESTTQQKSANKSLEVQVTGIHNKSDTNSNNKVEVEDWHALKTIFASGDGGNWNAQGWDQVWEDSLLANCDLLKMRGVTLNADKRVVALNLFSIDELKGPFPSQVGDLSELKYMADVIDEFCYQHSERRFNIGIKLTNTGRDFTIHIPVSEIQYNTSKYHRNVTGSQALKFYDAGAGTSYMVGSIAVTSKQKKPTITCPVGGTVACAKDTKPGKAFYKPECPDDNKPITVTGRSVINGEPNCPRTTYTFTHSAGSKGYNTIVLGKGDNVSRTSMSLPDVVTHEMVHHLTEIIFNKKFELFGETGALQESYADIFVEVTENHVTGTNDWVIGKEVTKDDIKFRISNYDDTGTDNRFIQIEFDQIIDSLEQDIKESLEFSIKNLEKLGLNTFKTINPFKPALLKQSSELFHFFTQKLNSNNPIPNNKKKEDNRKKVIANRKLLSKRRKNYR